MSLLARFSLANRGLIALMAVMITGFGLFAVPSLKQQLLPSMEIPAAFVMAAYPGAGPEIVEAQVTVPIEKAVQGVPGLESVTSTTREGLAFVQVGYEFGTDIDDAVNKMQTALNRISAQLPQGVEPTVLSGGTDDLPSLMLAASGAEMHGVACGRDLFKRPHLGVELRRLMQIAHAKLDAADAGHRAVRHGNRPLVIAWPEFRTVRHPEPACCGPDCASEMLQLGHHLGREQRQRAQRFSEGHRAQEHIREQIVHPEFAHLALDLFPHPLGRSGNHRSIGHALFECRAARHIEPRGQAGYAVLGPQPIQLRKCSSIAGLAKRFASLSVSATKM
jgi:hypothetical protein